MEVYELLIDESKGLDGVQAISLVSDPAIESDWVALNKEKLVLKAIDDEKRILMGAALIPNKKIFRKDKEGNAFYIFFSDKTVREASELFFKKGHQSKSTLEHAVNLKGNTVVESWIKEDEVNDKSIKYGLDAPIGSWIISMKIEDDTTYNLAKKGELSGFSIEGYFADMATKQNENKTKDNLNSHSIMNKVLEAIKAGFESVKLGKEEVKEKTELIQEKLDNGTLLEAEKFEAGEQVFIVNEDERVPLPEGKYEMSGKVLILSEEGVIEKVEDAEVVEKEEAETEESQFVSKDDFNKAIDEIKSLLTSHVTKLENEKTELQAKLDDKPDAEPVKVVPKEKVEMKATTPKGKILQAIRKVS